MSGLGDAETRQAIWEKQSWKNADEEQGDKLVFEDVEKLCRRMNIYSSAEELQRLFNVRFRSSICVYAHILTSF
jgi:phosphatidylinositol phospholipase C delta